VKSLGRETTNFPLARALLPLLTTVFIGVLLSTLLAYFYAKKTVTDLALGYTEQALIYLDGEVDAQIDRTAFNLDNWSREDVFHLALEDSYLGVSARKAALERLQARVRGSAINRIFLANPEGKVILASDPGMMGKFAVGDRKYFQRAMAGELAFQTIVSGRFSGHPILVAAAPLKDIHDRSIGVLVAVLDVASFTDNAVKKIRERQNYAVFILDQSGRELAATSPGDVGAAWPAELMAMVTESSKSDESLEINKNAEARMLQAKYNARSGWYLVVETDKAEILSPATRLGWITGSVSLATFFLVIFALGGLRKALAELRLSEDKFSRLFLLSPDAIILLDLQSMKIKEVNESFQGLFGITDYEARGRTLQELEIYADADIAIQAQEIVRKEGKVENLEFVARKRDGSIIACMMSGQVVALQSREHMIAIIRDVSELKRMHEMMVQSEKMMSLGGLAAGIAHEINNPLGIILASVQNCLRRVSPDFTKNRDVAEDLGLNLADVRAYLERRRVVGFLESIGEAADRAANIVRNMLEFSRRGESGKTPTSTNDLLEKTLGLAANDYDLKKNFDFRQIKIIRDYDQNLPPVSVTASEIEQVVLNILKNAAHALSQKEFAGDVPTITLTTRLEGAFVAIDISDNGPGMDEVVRRQIFEPFFTTKSPGLGTGLGLSVSYFIVVQNHKGRIKVDSSPGAGATFTIMLPRE